MIGCAAWTRRRRACLVLNARRHRDGDRSRRPAAGTFEWRCSTPGGIETVIGHVPEVRLCYQPLCSTPGGIETVIGRPGLEVRASLYHVLNARRHRDGDRNTAPSKPLTSIWCSTPGGIETVIGIRSLDAQTCVPRCSTPGGIETVIGAPPYPRRRPLPVLNARRHRDGDRTEGTDIPAADAWCSTPGGIETVIGRPSSFTWRSVVVCSTPGGIETVIGGSTLATTTSSNMCSTPGGIETVSGFGTSHSHRLQVGAQRPEASRR